jgi:hypothetical protein
MEATTITTLENGTETYVMTTRANKRSNEDKEARTTREDACYDRINKTQQIEVKDGFMTYTKHFKYLGKVPHIIQSSRRL